MRSQIQIIEERRGLRWGLRRITLAIVVFVLLIGAVIWLAGQSARATLVKLVQTTPVIWSQSSQPARELTQAADREGVASSVEFQLLTGFVNGKVSYIGVGGNIDGAVNPDLVVPPGASFQITLTNGDGMGHDLFIPELGIKSATVSRKDQATTLTVPVAQDQVGVYVYYCTQPGHRQAGQEGRLIVRAAE
jgi:nitrite reductase (NO-forming)